MIMNLSGGGNPKNVLVVYVKEANATVTVTNGTKTLNNVTDAAGYAYFTNLAIGNWTVSAVNSDNHPAPSTPTVTITATQISYYVAFGFEFWLYDNSFADPTLNLCTENSGGWEGSIGQNVANGIATWLNGGGSINVKNSFDLSKYNTLTVLANLSNGYNLNYMRVKASDKSTVLAQAEFATGKDNQWLTLDLSAITAVGYIYFQAQTHDVIDVHQCYLA